jgi:hypothetical protein
MGMQGIMAPIMHPGRRVSTLSGQAGAASGGLDWKAIGRSGVRTQHQRCAVPSGRGSRTATRHHPRPSYGEVTVFPWSDRGGSHGDRSPWEPLQYNTRATPRSHQHDGLARRGPKKMDSGVADRLGTTHCLEIGQGASGQSVVIPSAACSCAIRRHRLPSSSSQTEEAGPSSL